MKLIRNRTADGSCKYALIQLAKLPEQDAQDIVQTTRTSNIVEVPSEAILIGNESPADQFFVLKYKDKFTAAALIAYVQAVVDYADKLEDEEERRSLVEYASDIAKEAQKSLNLGDARHIPD